MPRKKFGLRSVRPPNHVIAALHTERHTQGQPPPMLYRVELSVPPKTRRGQAKARYVAYLCNADGHRLAGARNHYFNPRPYKRNKPAATAQTGQATLGERDGRHAALADEEPGCVDCAHAVHEGHPCEEANCPCGEELRDGLVAPASAPDTSQNGRTQLDLA